MRRIACLLVHESAAVPSASRELLEVALAHSPRVEEGGADHVYLDASATPSLSGVQTVDVPVGGGAIFEVRLAEPGAYPFVSHAFADATKGAVGVFRAKE